MATAGPTPFPQTPGAGGVVWPVRAWSGGTVDWAPGELPRLSAGEDLVVTFGFRCNLACTFCLVEDALLRFEGIRVETFRSWLREPALFRGVKRVILSGGEATLEPDLIAFAALARQVPGVEHVRIQTNATRLCERGALQRLIDAGIDEYFVSIHGDDEASTAAITQRKGAFSAIMAGIEAIAAHPAARLYTNTCIVASNVGRLTGIILRVAPYRPLCASFWNVHLRVDRADTRVHLARVADIRPELLRAFDRADALGLPTLVKWFPRCLLGHHADKHDDGQPTTLVEPEFWPAVPRYACLYRDACVHADAGCNGLSYPYIHTHGWEEDLLAPAPRPSAAPPGPGSDVTDELPVGQDAMVRKLADRLGLGAAAVACGFELGRALRQGRAVRIVLARGDAHTWIELADAAEPGPAWRRTASFAVRHARCDGALGAALAALLAAWRPQLDAADPGGLGLPWWTLP